MGIVVAVFMLLGVLMASPWVPTRLRVIRPKPNVVDTLATGLLLAGLWNSLWYGLRHMANFWGQAALVSGLLMVAVAMLLLTRHGSHGWRRRPAVVWVRAALKPLAGILGVALALCFGLYVWALVRQALPWDAAFLAGQAFRIYRQAMGTKASLMLGFYIGAHALVSELQLLTRDVARNRSCFPRLAVIAP